MQLQILVLASIITSTLVADREAIAIENLKQTIKIKSPGSTTGTFFIPKLFLTDKRI